MSNKPYPWEGKGTRIVFFPGMATVGLSLYAAPGVPIDIATLIVVTLAVTCGLVGVASAFAPHLPAILDALSIAATRRAARKREIQISEAKELIQAGEFPSTAWAHTMTSSPPGDCSASVPEPRVTDALASEALGTEQSPTESAELSNS